MRENSTMPTVLRVGDIGDTDALAALQDAGNTVVQCAGPRGSRCPLVAGDGCALVESAAGIVFDLDLDEPAHREIVRCYRDLPGWRPPLRVVATNDQRARHRDELAGIKIVETLDEPEIAEFSTRVALADMARQALSELVGGSRSLTRRIACSGDLEPFAAS